MIDRRTALQSAAAGLAAATLPAVENREERFGRRLREARERAGLSIAYVAWWLELLGVTAADVASWEAGTDGPFLPMLHAIKLYGVDWRWLIA